MIRLRLAAPVLVIYWLMLVGGLALYTAIRIDDAAAMVPLWIGAVSGTALGHALALRNVRLWAAFGLFLTVLLWFAPLLPAGLYPTHLSMAFLPAGLCALWSLSDRASLAAFWFPVMIWMLSILDRADGSTVPDRPGALLIAAVAALFIVFLRARETRRVGLWKTISTTPVAISGSPILLKQPAGHQVARVGWGLAITTLAFAITAWLAPQLWQNESFQADPIAIPDPGQLGLPCCPVADEIVPERARVKEYFDIGRGHDHVSKPPRETIDCQACDRDGMALVVPAAPDDVIAVNGVATDGSYESNTLPPDQQPAQGGTWSGEQRYPGADTAGTTARPSPSPSPTEAAPAPRPAPSAIPAPPAPTPQITTWDPPPVAVDPPQAKPAAVEPTQLAPPAPTPPKAAAAAPRPNGRGPRPAAVDHSRMPLHWAALLVLGAVIFQLLRISLRPLRRAIAVRHLRRPFWDETIDQRVSNSWQLALVGLRDAGWRASSTEAPREFARRAGVEGIERCAAILERARHGIAIDADDLAEMTASADTVYRSARTGIGPVTRVVAAMRWPLT